MRKKEPSAEPDAEAPANWIKTVDLVPWVDNPRVNDSVVADVASSIKRFGFASPIIARRDGLQVIAGHTRLKAAISLGLKTVPVRLMDLDQVDAQLLALADNKLNERAEWDDDKLAEVLLGLEDSDLSGLGWDDDELAALVCDVFHDDSSDDDVPGIVAGSTDSEPGVIYDLGPHRLLCGDSAVRSSWDGLLGGALLRCVWTDPPYGFSYVGKTDEAMTIQNDSMSQDDTSRLWAGAFGALSDSSEPGSPWYASGPDGPLLWRIGEVLEAFGWRRSLVWVKDRFVFGGGEYHYRHEAIFHGWFGGGPNIHRVPRTAQTVFEVARPSSSHLHPTMKPVALVEEMITNSSSPGDLVGDPFGGSGTTLIACAKSRRVARLIEIDPKYCDVIRRRWTQWAVAHGLDAGSGRLDASD